MDKVLEEYLTGISKLLNGQLRGAINLKARQDNEELIMLTLGDVFDKGLNAGYTKRDEEYTAQKLKDLLKDDNSE